jgi:hypothetical protein
MEHASNEPASDAIKAATGGPANHPGRPSGGGACEHGVPYAAGAICGRCEQDARAAAPSTGHVEGAKVLDAVAVRASAREKVSPWLSRQLIPVPTPYDAHAEAYRDGFVAWLCGHAREDNVYRGTVHTSPDDSEFRVAWFAGYDDARAKVPYPPPPDVDAPAAAIDAARAAGTTFDRPDVRAAIIVPGNVHGAAEADAYRDGAVARMDGVDVAKCPYPPRDPSMNPPGGLAGAWVDGWSHGAVGVARMTSDKNNPASGRFRVVDAANATHATSVVALAAALRGDVPVGVVRMPEYAADRQPLPDPTFFASSRVSMSPDAYVSPERARYDALARAHEHALRALQSHGFTRDGDEWRLAGAKVLSDGVLDLAQKLAARAGDRTAREPIKTGDRVHREFDHGFINLEAIDPPGCFALRVGAGEATVDPAHVEPHVYRTFVDLFHAIRKAANAGR